MNNGARIGSKLTFRQATKLILEGFDDATRSIEMLVNGHFLTRSETEDILACYRTLVRKLTLRVDRIERGRRSGLH